MRMAPGAAQAESGPNGKSTDRSANQEQHYNRERYHQGKGGKLVTPNLLAVNDNGADKVDTTGSPMIPRVSQLRTLLFGMSW